jgi:hypothetical protein
MADGSWGAFSRDEEASCWGTALAAITLLQTGGDRVRIRAAVRWLVSARCREASWLWRLKLKTIDKNIRMQPEKFGWGWVEDTLSWVIPTSMTVIALQQARPIVPGESADLERRLCLGKEMLLDRACRAGGWNAGNSAVYDVPLAPHLDATATALLALRDYHSASVTQRSLEWLCERVGECPSAYSVAWGLLAIVSYRQDIPLAGASLPTIAAHLERLVSDQLTELDTCTLAVSALALDAVGGTNPFLI